MAVKGMPDTAFLERLYAAIESDDIKKFASCAEERPCGSLCFGRFPVLSALYLHSSRKILRAYEKDFLKYNTWQQCAEPARLAYKFRQLAGKSLRLYLETVVTPAEMLLICDNTGKLKKLFPQLSPSPSVKERLKELYKIRYGLEVAYEGDAIILERRPVNATEKKRIAILCAAAAVFLGLVASVPFIVNDFKPFIKDKNGAFRVSRLSAIDFASQNDYVLKRNVKLPENFYAESVSCSIDGNGKAIEVSGESAPFNVLSGNFSNMTFKTTHAAPIINGVDLQATVENVTIEATVDGQVNKNFSFFVGSNYGTIRNVTLNASGNIEVLEPEKSGSVTCGGLAINNSAYTVSIFGIQYGKITDCKVNYNSLALSGVHSADASFGGIAGKNSGYITGCTTEGSLLLDTVDGAGICSENNYYVKTCTNGADITQSSDSNQWNPLVAGIVMTNNGPVEKCKNTGKLISRSTCTEAAEGATTLPYAMAAGIAGKTTGYIYASVNEGKIETSGNATVYAGGICAQSFSEVYNCLSAGDIEASGKEVYAGGVTGASSVTIKNNSALFGVCAYCLVTAKISSMGENAYAGGIAGFVNGQKIRITSISGVTEVYYGGALNCIFTGDCSVENGYSGQIAGACGINLLNGNEYVWENTAYKNFDKNLAKTAQNVSAFGATIDYDEKGEVIHGGSVDYGVERMDVESIKSSETYKGIIAELNKE